MGKAKDTTRRITISLETETPEGRAAWDWLVAAQEDGSSISQIVAGLIKAAARPDPVAATFTATGDATSQRQDSDALGLQGQALLAEILKAIQEQPAALASALGQALKGVQLHITEPTGASNGNGHAGHAPESDGPRLDDDALEKRKQRLLKRKW